MKLTDITIESVRRAYEQTGCTPGTFFNANHRKDVCPLEALARFHGIKYWGDVLEQSESADFTAGYDGVNWSAFMPSDLKGKTEAFLLGCQIRKALRGET